MTNKWQTSEKNLQNYSKMSQTRVKKWQKVTNEWKKVTKNDNLQNYNKMSRASVKKWQKVTN